MNSDEQEILGVPRKEGGTIYVHPFLLLDGDESFMLGLCAPTEEE